MTKKTENPPKAPVRPLKTIAADSKTKILIILMNWQDIVGKGNSKIMMPLEIKQKTLDIAIPNNMVLSAAAKFSPVIIKKANTCFGKEVIEKLNFTILPAYFKKEKTEKKVDNTSVPEISEEEILQKKQELISKFALSENIAERAAKIELLNIRGKNEQ